ncbi:hypothetical protein [uncultured Aquimarina sp.]|uniref:hypothetical protein n=1 Tax=uncultured Aquimarina sp. TaxID=575652 RepID=UPI002637AA96|nr:hypothetical protein [uncultured Aquimarina sp.]
MAFLSLVKNNYFLSYVQILMYSQFFFYFFYFFSFLQEEKAKIITDLKLVADKVLVFVILLAFVELFLSDFFREFMALKHFDRGIGRFYLVSFFGSGPSLANFTAIYLFLWHYYYYGLENKITRKAKALLVMSVIICILSFSRKEVFLTFLFLIFFPYPGRSKIYLWIRRAITFSTVLLGLFVYYQVFFSTANKVALSSKYVRWKIVDYSYTILSDNFPFGTGVGTFGSKMSLELDHIYRKYNVGPEMLGYKSTGRRGPIYDAFLFTFTTEIGIGILLFVCFFYLIYRCKPNIPNAFNTYIKRYIVFYVLLISFFTPVLVNSFGFMVAGLLGAMCGNINLLRSTKNA